MNIKESLKKTLDNVRVIDDERNYWFVRTFGGEVYDDFIKNNHIGLGFNNIPRELILAADSYDKQEAHKVLRDFIENNTKVVKGTATNQKNQLVRFQHEMKIGDLVIIPNRNSHVFSIGEITSNVKIFQTNNVFFFKDNHQEYPNTVREIKWLSHKNRSFFKGDLRNLLSSQQGISNANSYGDKIESGVSNMFIRGNFMKLVINIKQDEDINAYQLNRFLTSITYFYDELCDELGIDRNEELYIKIKLQSPGFADFKGYAIKALTGVAVLIALSRNAEFKGNISKAEGLNFEFNSGDSFLKTILDSYSDFLDKDVERKIKLHEMIESSKSLEIENPYDSSDSVNISNVIKDPKLNK